MISRVLDLGESVPCQSGLTALLPYIPNGDSEVVVVEDAGRIVACWAVMRITHLEGAWIAPEYRGNAGVVRRLIKKTYAVASRTASGWVMTGAADDHVRDLITRLGGVKMPMDAYAMPIGGK